MIQLGSSFEEHTCPKCGKPITVMIRTDVGDYGTRLRKSVFDVCPKCLVRVTNIVQIDRELTADEIKELYPNGQTKLKNNDNKDKRTNKRGSSSAK